MTMSPNAPDPTAPEIRWGAFGKAFFEAFTRPGFGRMLKRDIEVLTLHLVEQHTEGKAARDCSDMALARLLKSTPTRIKNLRRDARYLHWDEAARRQHAREAFFHAVAHGAFGARAEDGMVSLSLTDAFVREQVIALLSDNYRTHERAFNRSLIKLSPEDLAFLFDVLLTEEERDVLRRDPETRKLLAVDAFRDRVLETLGAVAAGGETLLKPEPIQRLFHAAAAEAWETVAGFLWKI